MKPDRFTAEQSLKDAYKSNPGPWADHSRHVAEAFERIASHCGHLSSERAYILGGLSEASSAFLNYQKTIG